MLTRALYGDRAVPCVDVELMQTPRPAGDVGVVDQHVELSEVGYGAVGQRGDWSASATSHDLNDALPPAVRISSTVPRRHRRSYR
jgi:hypothetical protein